MNILLAFLLLLLTTTSYSQEIVGNSIIYKGNKYPISEIEQKCQNVKKQIDICTKIQNYNNNLPVENPLYGDYSKFKKDNISTDVYGTFGFLGTIKGYDVQATRQYENFGFGAFFKNVKVNNIDNGATLTGNVYGATIRYSIIPNFIIKNKDILQPGLYFGVGMAQLESDFQGTLPSYIYINSGLDLAYPLKRYDNVSINGYLKVDISEIYHSESGMLHLGTGFSFGLKVEF